jgi:hypothetical protein
MRDGRRLLIADLDVADIIYLTELADVQQEQDAGVVFITGGFDPFLKAFHGLFRDLCFCKTFTRVRGQGQGWPGR